MQEKQLFEYAIIRVVPKVEREEFINVGVILYSKQLKYLRSVFQVNEKRLKALCDTIDLEEVTAYLKAFERICEGSKGAP